MALGNTEKIFAERGVLREGERELSERTFNLIIGGMLLWGFLLNYLIVALFERNVGRLLATTGPWGFLIGYIVLVLIGNWLIGAKGPALSFLGYNLIALPVGVVVCLCVEGIPASTVKTAVLITAIVTLSFMIAATVFPDFFLGLGRTLFFGLLIALAAELVVTFIFRVRSSVFEWIFVGLFSLYIGFDWSRANTCARTLDNAIDLSASLYLDIINLFLRVLRIIAKHKD